MAEDQPDDLAHGCASAREAGPRWRTQIGRWLARMPDTAARFEIRGA